MKTLRTVGMIAGAIALVSTGLGAVGVGTIAGVSTSTIATVASTVATAASLGSALLAKKPPAQGSVNNVTIGVNQPIPYSMGRCFYAGTQVHDVGYGGKVDKVKNPYLTKVLIYSASTCEAIDDYIVDWQSVNLSGNSAMGYYLTWLYVNRQIGLRPEPAALAGPWGAVPDWGAGHKLSGFAAAMVSMRFDKKGKVWANGVPVMGPVGRWAKVYDARKDDTYPGGAGAHRFADEDTFQYDDNVALNALTYARGRFARKPDGSQGQMVVGCGFPADAIDWPAWVAWANICDANGWTVGGTVFDGPGISRWDNLKRICLAGGAVPCFSGGKLSVRFQSPKVALDTITEADLADGEYVAPAMRTYRHRVNTIVPKFRSEQNRWEMAQSKAVSVPAYVIEDGDDPKEEEVEYLLVTDKDQAAQLGAYELVNRRELSGISLPLKPRLWGYRLGECLRLDLPSLGLDHLAIITAVSKDVATGIVTMTFDTESNDKHPFALGQTGTAPPPPTLVPPGEGDDVAWNGNEVDDPTPSEWTVSTSLAVDSSGTLRAGLQLVGTATDDNVGLITFEYRVDGSSSWTTSASVVAQAPTRHEIIGLNPDLDYEVGITYLGDGSAPVPSARLVLGPFGFDTAAIAPAPATGLAATPGAGSCALAWRNPSSTNFGYCRVYRGTTTVFADATEIAGPIVGGLGQVMTYTDTVAAGSYHYWVRAFSSSAIGATPTGPVAATVT